MPISARIWLALSMIRGHQPEGAYFLRIGRSSLCFLIPSTKPGPIPASALNWRIDADWPAHTPGDASSAPRNIPHQLSSMSLFVLFYLLAWSNHRILYLQCAASKKVNSFATFFSIASRVFRSLRRASHLPILSCILIKCSVAATYRIASNIDFFVSFISPIKFVRLFCWVLDTGYVFLKIELMRSTAGFSMSLQGLFVVNWTCVVLLEA